MKGEEVAGHFGNLEGRLKMMRHSDNWDWNDKHFRASQEIQEELKGILGAALNDANQVEESPVRHDEVTGNTSKPNFRANVFRQQAAVIPTVPANDSPFRRLDDEDEDDHRDVPENPDRRNEKDKIVDDRHYQSWVEKAMDDGANLLGLLRMQQDVLTWLLCIRCLII